LFRLPSSAPGWALPADNSRYISPDEPYWGRVLDEARTTYGDPNIHYNTDDHEQERLVVADNATGRTHYRMLETVGHYRQFPRFARSSQRSP
jgi:hypothetical protein